MHHRSNMLYEMKRQSKIPQSIQSIDGPEDAIQRKARISAEREGEDQRSCRDVVLYENLWFGEEGGGGANEDLPFTVIHA